MSDESTLPRRQRPPFSPHCCWGLGNAVAGETGVGECCLLTQSSQAWTPNSESWVRQSSSTSSHIERQLNTRSGPREQSWLCGEHRFTVTGLLSSLGCQGGGRGSWLH